MEPIKYQADITITPSIGRRGESATLTATLSDVVGEIKQVIMTVPGYNIYQYLMPQGNHVYSVSMTIPWEAPSGSYSLSIYALGPDNSRGPVISKPYTIQ